MEKYDAICSLGYNCEVSFRIEDYSGQLNSTPFTWSFATNRRLFVKALGNVEEIFRGEVTIQDDNMFMDEQFGLKFHPRYSIFPHKGAYTDKQAEEAMAELKSRVEHLKESFEKLCKSGKRVLFILKVDDNGDSDNADYILSVAETLNTIISGGKYTLAIVMIKGHVGELVKALQSDRIRIYEVKKFANQRFTDIGGDVSGWLKIFRDVCRENGSISHFYSSLYKKRWKRCIAAGKNKLIKAGKLIIPQKM